MSGYLVVLYVCVELTPWVSRGRYIIYNLFTLELIDIGTLRKIVCSQKTSLLLDDVEGVSFKEISACSAESESECLTGGSMKGWYLSVDIIVVTR